MAGQTVLLVDDEPDILQLLEITLARMNLNTVRAGSIAEAESALQVHAPDLCLTDMKLPDGNGLSLIQHIQENYPDLPVAMITAHGSVESAIEALKLGAFDFVTKPLALEKLRELVGHALDMGRSSHEEGSLSLIGNTPPHIAPARTSAQSGAQPSARAYPWRIWRGQGSGRTPHTRTRSTR